MLASDCARAAKALADMIAHPALREAARQQAEVEARAIRLKNRLPLTDDVAVRIVLFARGNWAQRYPVKSFDLGEAAEDFFGEWTLAHHESSADALHRALGELDGGRFMARMNAAIAGGVKEWSMTSEVKEGEVVLFSDGGEEPREMRVTRVRRTGPNTVDVTLEAVSGPSELRRTCPYMYAGGCLSGIGTSRTCETHGENREKRERWLAERQKVVG